MMIQSTGAPKIQPHASIGVTRNAIVAVILSVLALYTSCPGAGAFVHVSSPTAGRTALFLEGNARVMKAGGGVAVIPPGGRLLFDPSVEGMLGGQEVDSLTQRLESGVAYSSTYLPAVGWQNPSSAKSGAVPSVRPPPGVEVRPAQAWLEDIGSPLVPPAFAKATAPVTATVLGRARLITADAPGDIQHVVLKLPEGFHYVEGQSLSVIPPGVDALTGRPHKPRLYSIASTRYGDLLDGTTVSLCVRRAEYYDPVTGLADPARAGVCSKFLCDATPGTTVQVAGPVGKTMLLPEDPTTDLIMVATGTGIAPFRAFLHRLFVEETPARHMFQGRAWLILGVPVTGGLLYKEEWDAMKAASTRDDALEVTYAISREMQNARGGKLYVQDVLTEQADKLFGRLEGGAHIYFCGLKGMMPGILDALEQVCAVRGLDWAAKLKEWKGNDQWHVEVY
jgi:ferredoxin--NADP+ reductase